MASARFIQASDNKDCRRAENEERCKRTRQSKTCTKVNGKRVCVHIVNKKLCTHTARFSRCKRVERSLECVDGHCGKTLVRTRCIQPRNFPWRRACRTRTCTIDFAGVKSCQNDGQAPTHPADYQQVPFGQHAYNMHNVPTHVHQVTVMNSVSHDHDAVCKAFSFVLNNTDHKQN